MNVYRGTKFIWKRQMSARRQIKRMNSSLQTRAAHHTHLTFAQQTKTNLRTAKYYNVYFRFCDSIQVVDGLLLHDPSKLPLSRTSPMEHGTHHSWATAEFSVNTALCAVHIVFD